MTVYNIIVDGYYLIYSKHILDSDFSQQLKKVVKKYKGYVVERNNKFAEVTKLFYEKEGLTYIP